MKTKKKFDLKNHKYTAALVAAWGGGFLILAVCYVIFHLPVKQKLEQVQQQYAESEDLATIARKAARQEVRDRLKQRCEEAEQTVRHFSVPQENTTGLVFEIGKIANELDLSEFSSKHQPIRNFATLGENTNLTEAALKVEFNSSFLKFAQFVNRLERQSPVVFIERMTFRRKENQDRQHDVEMELSFMVSQNQDQNHSVAIADAAALN